MSHDTLHLSQDAQGAIVELYQYATYDSGGRKPPESICEINQFVLRVARYRAQLLWPDIPFFSLDCTGSAFQSVLPDTTNLALLKVLKTGCDESVMLAVALFQETFIPPISGANRRLLELLQWASCTESSTKDEE